MPDVFISYAKGDGKRVAMIAEALEAAGFSVRWDEPIKGGKAGQDALQEQFRAAYCVIVCWSRAAAKSDVVLTEANQAFNQQKLIPVTLQACDPPMPFNMVPSADLTEWRGEGDNEYWVETLEEARRLVAKGRALAPTAPAPQQPRPTPPPQQRRAAAPPTAREEIPAESPGRSPRYKTARARKKSGAGGLVIGLIATAAIAAGAIWAGPKAFNYIGDKLGSPPQREEAAVDSSIPAPFVTEISSILAIVPEPSPPSVAPAAPAPAKASAPAKAPPPSIKPASVVAPPSVAPPPKVMVALTDMEDCLRQVARACDASSAEFRADGQLSASERRLMSASLFPDGAAPTEANLVACKANTSRRALNTEVGKTACATILPAALSSQPPANR